LVLLICSRFDFFYFPEDFFGGNRYLWLAAASIIVLGLGAIDDFRRIPPSVKLFFQIVAGLIVALTSQRIGVIISPFGTIYLGACSIPVTILWVVAITNAINLVDGLDGLAGGTSLIVCFTMFGISLLNNNILVALISVILAGNILGFLKYNFHPASIFLGDSGAYFLGFTLSVLSLMSNMKGTTTFAILIPLIALGLPIMDTLISMLRRLLQSLHILAVDRDRNVLKFLFINGKSIVKADRDHIHHRLLKMGFTQRNAVVILYAITLLLGGIAFISVYFRDVNQALLVAAVAIASYIGIRKLGYNEIQFLRNGSLLPLFNSNLASRGLFKVFVDMGLIAFSYYGAFLLRFEGKFVPDIREYYLATIPIVLSVKLLIFSVSGLYNGPWRYINVDDFLRIIKANVLGCAATAVLLWVVPTFEVMSWAVVFIDFNLLCLFLIAARSSFRVLEYLHLSKNQPGKKVLIYGLGRSGVHALNEFINNPRLNLSPVGFIDDDERNRGKHVSGYPVFGTLAALENILSDNPVSEVIVSQDDLSVDKLEYLYQICASHQISLRRLQTSLEEIPLQSNHVVH
jgi:UDP-GlcNAc:undecaprenyl-phosphate GlcNAc-1-phosphate transferase